MSRQLDILAIEPYFGGIRRNMLEALGRFSRHRWTLMTLPPRRLERRLAASAHWFAEQMAPHHARHQAGHIDVLFTSDALNLCDFFRLCPAVVGVPSVAYFHCNQLPDFTLPVYDASNELTNLMTAAAATEIWFNSDYHSRSFLAGIKGLIQFHPELQVGDPLGDLQQKLKVIPPPVDMTLVRDIAGSDSTAIDPHSIFINTHDTHFDLLNAALEILYVVDHKIHILASGPVNQLSNRFPITGIADHDFAGQICGLRACGAYVSTDLSAPFDEHAVRAMLMIRRPVLPDAGFYPELVPAHLHRNCFYDLSAEGLAAAIHESLFRLPNYRIEELPSTLGSFDAFAACAVIDDHLDRLASRSGAGAEHNLVNAPTTKVPRPLQSR